MNTLYSIPELPSLSRRQIIERSVRHVLNNGRPSIKPKPCEPSPVSDGNETLCMYGGIGCGAAPFLTDEGKEYGDDGNKSWYKLVGLGVVSDHEADLISLLQNVHDLSVSNNCLNFIRRYRHNLVRNNVINADDPLLS